MEHLYNSYECRACYREYENDKHVLECSTLLKMNKEYEFMKVPEYEKLYKGNPKEQLEISRMFMSNMKILENIKEENQNLSNILDPCDQSYFSASAVYTGTMYKLHFYKANFSFPLAHYCASRNFYFTKVKMKMWSTPVFSFCLLKL